MLLKPFLKLWLLIKYKLIKGNAEKSKNLAAELVKENNLNDHYSVGRFVDQKMTYKYDDLRGVIDIIQDLDSTVKRGYEGDCDDFSMLAYRLLQQIDVEPELITIVPLRFWKSHVLCLYQVDQDYYFISTNGNSANGPFKNLEQIFDYLNYKKVLIYSIDQID